MKDKLGHGSEKHREFHKPQVEHGGYVKGTEYHANAPKFADYAASRLGKDYSIERGKTKPT